MPSSLANLRVLGLAPVELDNICCWIIFELLISSFFIKFSFFISPLFSFGVCCLDSFWSVIISKIVSPSDTLSPILIFIFEIFPLFVEGTSTLDLSLSK